MEFSGYGNNSVSKLRKLRRKFVSGLLEKYGDALFLFLTKRSIFNTTNESSRGNAGLMM